MVTSYISFPFFVSFPEVFDLFRIRSVLPNCCCCCCCCSGRRNSAVVCLWRIAAMNYSRPRRPLTWDKSTTAVRELLLIDANGWWEMSYRPRTAPPRRLRRFPRTPRSVKQKEKKYQKKKENPVRKQLNLSGQGIKERKYCFNNVKMEHFSSAK